MKNHIKVTLPTSNRVLNYVSLAFPTVSHLLKQLNIYNECFNLFKMVMQLNFLGQTYYDSQMVNQLKPRSLMPLARLFKRKRFISDTLFSALLASSHFHSTNDVEQNVCWLRPNYKQNIPLGPITNKTFHYAQLQTKHSTAQYTAQLYGDTVKTSTLYL